MKALLIAIAICITHGFVSGANAEPEHTNIVVIMADDLGWKDLHCYSHEKVDTPHLDQLATEGMRFTEGYAASPVCSPTRSAMMTGLAPARTRLTNHAPGHKDGFSLEGSNLSEAKSVRRLDLSYNGDNRPLRGFKGMMFEGGIRVPWIIRWPGVTEAGSVNHTPIISMDSFPTILDVAGIDRSDIMTDGKSLVPLLKKTNNFDREAIYFHYPNYAFHKKNRMAGAIRSGKYKLIRRYDDESLELYNLELDIGERKNLAAQLPEVAGSLKVKLNQWLKETGAQFPTRSQ